MSVLRKLLPLVIGLFLSASAGNVIASPIEPYLLRPLGEVLRFNLVVSHDPKRIPWSIRLPGSSGSGISFYKPSSPEWGFVFADWNIDSSLDLQALFRSSSFSQGSNTSGGMSGASFPGSGSFSCTVGYGPPGKADPAQLAAIIRADTLARRIIQRTNAPEERSQSPPHHSCFISYSSADEKLVRRLVKDLKKNGVEVWFAPDRLKIGDVMRDAIHKAIAEYDRVLVVLSKDSIESPYVRSEVEMGFQQERKRKEPVVLAVRVDAEISADTLGWAGDLQRIHHVGDLTEWRKDRKYKATLARILADLVKNAA